jgi:hypothetical protein
LFTITLAQAACKPGWARCRETQDSETASRAFCSCSATLAGPVPPGRLR